MSKEKRKTAYIIDRFVIIAERLSNNAMGCPRYSFDIFPLVGNEVLCTTYVTKGHYLSERQEVELILQQHLNEIEK